ncbi:MAG: hypothetical protein ACHQPH_16850 [Reyranellales bacterium]
MSDKCFTEFASQRLPSTAPFWYRFRSAFDRLSARATTGKCRRCGLFAHCAAQTPIENG